MRGQHRSRSIGRGSRLNERGGEIAGTSNEMKSRKYLTCKPEQPYLPSASCRAGRPVNSWVLCVQGMLPQEFWRHLSQESSHCLNSFQWFVTKQRKGKENLTWSSMFRRLILQKVVKSWVWLECMERTWRQVTPLLIEAAAWEELVLGDASWYAVRASEEPVWLYPMAKAWKKTHALQANKGMYIGHTSASLHAGHIPLSKGATHRSII